VPLVSGVITVESTGCAELLTNWAHANPCLSRAIPSSRLSAAATTSSIITRVKRTLRASIFLQNEPARNQITYSLTINMECSRALVLGSLRTAPPSMEGQAAQAASLTAKSSATGLRLRPDDLRRHTLEFCALLAGKHHQL